MKIKRFLMLKQMNSHKFVKKFTPVTLAMFYSIDIPGKHSKTVANGPGVQSYTGPLSLKVQTKLHFTKSK